MREVKLIIKDEVNAKFQGLELTDRKKLVDDYKFELPGARYLPAVKLGRWDGKVSYFQLGGSTYVGLLDDIIPKVVDMGYNIELEDLRTPWGITFSEFTADTFSHVLWPEGHMLAGQPILFRERQVDAINAFLSNHQCIQSLPTGFGKTVLTAALSKSVEPFGKSVVIVPSKTLVTQTEADYINMGLDVGVYYGDRKELGKTHTICTWQSINALIKSGDKDKLFTFIEGVICVISDECHGSKADVLKSILTGIFAHVPIRWGLTGTIPKEPASALSLLCSIGPVVNYVKAKDLQDDGDLSNCHVNVLQLQDWVEYKDYPSELKYLVTNTDRLAFLASRIAKISDTGNTLVLVDRIETGKKLQEFLGNSLGVEVSFVSGTTKGKDRQSEYDSIADATGKVIIATYGVAAVGINIPRIFNLVMIEPGKSFTRVIQSIGRGIRRAVDKDFVNIWDITSNCKFSKRHLTKRKAFYKEAEYPFTVEKINWQEN